MIEGQGLHRILPDFGNGFAEAIDIVASCIYNTAADNGFWDDERNDGEMLMLIVTELVEHFERLRSKEPDMDDEHCPDFSNAEIELADAVIRIMDYAKGRGHRLGEAIVAKHNYNTTREYKHGKRF